MTATLADFTDLRLLAIEAAAVHRDAVIATLATRMHAAGLAPDLDALIAGVQARERLAPTAVGDELAVPHLRDASLPALMFACAVTRQPISWSGTPVRCVILVAVPPARAGDYLRLLMALATLFQDPLARAALLAAATPFEMLEVLAHAPVPGLSRSSTP